MRELPSGTVTFMFTDIEGSTKLLQKEGDRYADLLAAHRRVMRAAIDAHGGVEIGTEGDSFFVTFERAADAVRAATDAQAGLADGPIRVRMGLHTGEPLVTDEGYVGLDVHRAARIAAAGHGGQVLLSEATRRLVEADVKDLGLHRLKDLQTPEHIFQLGHVDFPPLKSLNKTNLPVQPTPFLGRDEELAFAVEQVENPAVRVVTLTGPGGTGKTRLALQTAAEVVESFDGGVFFVPLASLADADLLPATIAAAMGLRESAEATPEEAVVRYVGSQRALLVLDNLEQLLPACATTVARLCGASGGLTILATSREPLRITGEHEYPVTPLVDADAVELFVQSARAVQPTFRPGDDQWAVIEAICTRLDRLPLALELAAARLRVLSLPDLLERLERRLPLLKGGGRDAPERQRTLQATIAWSYDLLTEVDQRAFARLSVFTGGASLDAAFDVCDVDLDAIEALVDKSLLRRADGPGRESRIAMLETIREFALDRLDEHPDADDVRRAHADYFLRAAEAAEPLLMGREQVTWLDRFENDHDNLRSALEWLLDHDPQRALRLAAALWLFWYMHGHVTEGRRWLQLALDKASPDPTLERAKALDGAGYLAGEQGDQSCRTLLEESLTCAREVGVPAVVAMAASHLSVFMGMDEGPQARALGEEAVALARRANDRYTLAVALNNLGQVFLYQFQDPTATKDMWKESLAIRREIGDASRVALSLSNLATLELLGGDFARAADFAREALELAEGIGDKRHMCFSHANLGWAALGQGRADEALEYFGRSLLLARDIGNAQGILENLMGFAAAAASTGEVLRAARLVGAVEALDDLVGVKLSETETAPLVERFIGAARSTVEVADWETARADGAAMNLDAAIRFASGTV